MKSSEFALHTQQTEPLQLPQPLSQSQLSLPPDAFEQQNPQLTIRYLKQYLQKLEVQNCRLKNDVQSLRLELSLSRAALSQKDTELTVMRSYKDKIEESVQRVTEYNQQYIGVIEMQQAEIEDIRTELERWRGTQQGRFAPEFTLQKRFEVPHYDQEEEERDNSSVRAHSILDRAKEYVKQIKSARNNVGDYRYYSQNLNREYRDNFFM